MDELTFMLPLLSFSNGKNIIVVRPEYVRITLNKKLGTIWHPMTTEKTINVVLILVVVNISFAFVMSFIT